MSRALLIVGAFEPELAPLKERLSCISPALTYQLHFAAVGVGAVAAAVGTIRAVQALNSQGSCFPDLSATHLIFVGSLGGYNQSSPLLRGFLATESRLLAPEVERGEAYFPAPLICSYEAHQPWREQILSTLGDRIQSGPVYSPLAISKNSTLSPKLIQAAEPAGENLELFGIAEACAQLGLSWSALGVVTNRVGPEAHSEWRKNFETAAEITADLVCSLFS